MRNGNDDDSLRLNPVKNTILLQNDGGIPHKDIAEFLENGTPSEPGRVTGAIAIKWRLRGDDPNKRHELEYWKGTLDRDDDQNPCFVMLRPDLNNPNDSNASVQFYFAEDIVNKDTIAMAIPHSEVIYYEIRRLTVNASRASLAFSDQAKSKSASARNPQQGGAFASQAAFHATARVEREPPASRQPPRRSNGPWSSSDGEGGSDNEEGQDLFFNEPNVSTSSNPLIEHPQATWVLALKNLGDFEIGVYKDGYKRDKLGYTPDAENNVMLSAFFSSWDMCFDLLYITVIKDPNARAKIGKTLMKTELAIFAKKATAKGDAVDWNAVQMAHAKADPNKTAALIAVNTTARETTKRGNSASPKRTRSRNGKKRSLSVHSKEDLCRECRKVDNLSTQKYWTCTKHNPKASGNAKAAPRQH